MARWTLLLLVAVLSACATTPAATGDPRLVAVVDTARDVDACDDLGQVVSRIPLDGGIVPPQAAIERAVEDLQLQTVSAGGDTLWLQHIDLRPTEVYASGHAYRCRPD